MKYTPPVLRKFIKNITGNLPVKAAVPLGMALAVAAMMAPTAQAAPIAKLGTGTNLLDGASWNGGVTPTSADVATWDGTSLGAGLYLGANTNWLGVSVSGGLTDISVTGAGVLTVGSSGFDLSASANNMTLANTINLGAGQSWNVNSGRSLSVGRILNSPYNLTKTGSGSLTLGTAAASILNGVLDIQSGAVLMAGDLTVTNLTGSGTLETSGTGVNKWFFVNAPSDSTFSGSLINFPGTTGRGMGLTKTGTGALTLNGIVTINDSINVNGGTLNLVGTGVAITNFNNSANILSVASAGSARAVLNLSDGATLLANYNPANIYNTSAQIGSGSSSAGSMSLSSGRFNAAKQLNIASGATSYGTFNQSGGTSTIGGFLALCVGSTSSRAVFDQSGGSFTMSSAPATIGANATGIGVLNLSGTAAFTNNATGDNGLWFAENGTGILNVSGSATLSLATGNNGVQLGRNASGVGTANLLGGTVITKAVYKGAGTGTLNFNGGTLKANQANASFLTGLNAAYVYGGGATIDDGGFAITVGQQLMAPSGDGVASISVTAGGSGYLGAPVVTITGDGSGATAVATVSGGAVTGITITSPGVNYTTASATLSGGGGTGATLGTPTLTANTSGGLTKTGNGTLTLSGGYNYTGPTKVLGGTLVLNTSLGVPGTGGDLVVSNATLTLDASGAVLPANNVTVGSTLNLNLSASANAISGTGNMTLGDNTTNNLSYGTLSSAPTAAALKVSGTLAKGTNIVFNISGVGLQPNWVVPLVEADSTAMTTNGFVLGSLPSGIKAVLTNDATYPNTISMLVTSAGQLLTWRGSEDGATPALNWNVNTTTNWYALPGYAAAKYLQYLGDTTGDNVTFGDSALYTDGTNHVNVATNVVPATVFFSSSSPYELSGVGGIGGTTSVVLTNNSAAVYLHTTNTYSGGTVVASGTLVITNDAALGSSGVNMVGGTLRAEADVTSSRPVTFTANSTLTAPAGITLALNGSVGGTAVLTKSDDGTLTLAGNNSYGSTLVGGGTVNIAGAVTNGSIMVGGASANGVLDISGTLVTSNLFVGNTDYAVGAVYQTAGTVTVAGGGGDLLNLGNMNNTYGYYNAAGGTLNLKGISIGGGSNTITGQPWPPVGNNAYGLMEVNGATINNDNGWIVLARGSQNNIGVLNMISGSLTYGDGGIGCNWQTTVDGTQTSIINVMGGLLSTTNTAVEFRTANTGILNLNGGVLQTVNVTGYGDINFNGGTIRAVANNSTFLNVNSNIYIYSGGANIDDNGKAITIAHALLGATNNGLSGINIDFAGSGYVAPPILTISGDGRGASAIAQIDRSAGTVTNVIITCPGDGYTYANITVTGGGAVSAASFSATGYSANTSGGLTKTGAGTLSLIGANTYTGATVVAQGTLFLTPVCQNTNSDMVLSNATFLTISATDNAITRVGDLTIGGPATNNAEIAFQLPTGTNPVAALLECGSLTLNGTNNIRVSGLLTSGTFPVLKYSSITGASLLNPALRAPHGYSGVVSNDNATKTIYITLSGAGGIVWQGYNPSLALTNLWDTTTTNWLSGIDLATYIEGDKVVFDDTGSGLVLLSNTVSPGGMVITNNSVSYTLQGPGIVSGVGGLTKVGPGSATVNFAANNFSGPTIVSNGVLNISGGGAIGDTSAVTLKDVAGVSLVINNSEIIGSLAGGGATGGNVSLSGTLTAGGNNATTTYAGAISGSGSLTKVGTGALSLGGSNSVSGNVTVNNGALNLAGSGSLNSIRLFVGAGGTTGTVAMVTGTTLTNNYSAPGSWWADYALALGVDNNGLGTLNMSGGTLNLTGNVWVSCWGGTGNWNQTGGTANISGNFWVGGMQDNDSAQPNGSIGTAIISNATLSAGNVRVGRGGVDNGGTQAVATSRVKGDMTVANGGVVNSENDLQVGYSGSGSSGWGSYGTLNIENGGIVNVASTTERWMTVGRYNSIDATVNIKSGGTLNLNAGTDLMINEGNNTGIRVVNVAGTLQGTAAGGSYIDLNRNATADGTTTFNITNGGVVAVDAIVGKANCTLNFDNGTLKATADDANFIGAGFTANILTGGVTLNTDGHNPTVPGILLNNGVDEDGGLTKTGNGTLYLNGANTYTNVTTVNAGLLGGTGTIAGRVVVNSGAGLAPGNSIGALTINGNITLNASSTNVFEVDGTTPANDQVVAGANVTYGGVLKIVPTGTFTNGQEFVLFSGAGAANASNFASINSGSPSLVLSFTNGVLTVVSSMAAYSTNITAVVNGSNLEITWPSTHQGWMIEAQTNTIAVGLLTNGWVTISNTASVTGFTNTLNSENGAVFYRLRKP